MLAVLKPRELRRRLKGRGAHAVQRRAERYLKHFDAIWQLQSFLLSEADQFDVPIVSNEKKSQASQELMAIINQELTRQFSGSPSEVFGPNQGPGRRAG
jgi:2-phosphoglycerate kinase